MAQSDKFNKTFGGEDGDEDGVNKVEDILDVLRSIIELDSHREHIEKDDQHNEDVEFLISSQFEDRKSPLQLYRYKRTTQTDNIAIYVLFR